MARIAEPPFTQQDLLYAAARKLGSLNADGTVRPQVTATRLGLGPNGTQRISRLLKGAATLHWDEAYFLYQALGWINERSVEHDLREAQRAAKAAEASARRARAAAERQPRDEQSRPKDWSA